MCLTLEFFFHHGNKTALPPVTDNSITNLVVYRRKKKKLSQGRNVKPQCTYIHLEMALRSLKQWLRQPSKNFIYFTEYNNNNHKKKIM